MKWLILGTIFLSIYFAHKRKKEKEVPQGLETYDKNGNVLMSVTTPNIFIYGYGFTSYSAGKLVDARIKKGKTFIYAYKKQIALKDKFLYTEPGAGGYPINFNIEDGEISWDWDEYGGNMNFNDNYIQANWFIYGGYL